MKQKIILSAKIVLVVLMVLIAIMGTYMSSYNLAEDEAAEALKSTETVTVEKISGIKYAFVPKGEIKAGLIFYPGAKVEWIAYAPVMQEMANKGILCVLCHMPGNIAFFNTNAANGIQKKYSSVKDWYIGGHSLGGVVAANYVSGHLDEYKGIIFFASYTTKDLSNSNLKCLSLLGDKDTVLDMDSYNKNKSNMPKNAIEYTIKGGCHSYFGVYCPQDGDGVPEIERDEQIKIIAEQTSNFIYE